MFFKNHDYQKLSLDAHKHCKGKLKIEPKLQLNNTYDLSIAYTPGVAEPCKKIYENKKEVYTYTIKQNTVAVVTDGSAVLGLGNIGPEAALPVMEGKALLFKKFAGIDAFPICIATQNVDKIVETVKLISPVFGGINLEDISAPRCFEIEERLKTELNIPVFHDDQHGSAIAVLAALINSLKVVKKAKETLKRHGRLGPQISSADFRGTKIIVNGAGAAGTAITKLLVLYGFREIIVCDSKGAIYEGRNDLNRYKEELAKITNSDGEQGQLKDIIAGKDIFIGVSVGNILTEEMVKSMAESPIIFALANPTPEIAPDKAKKAGAAIIGTGRSDFPNQINNALVFPGIFRAALDARITKITDEMKIEAAEALAGMIKNPTKEKIIPSIFDKQIIYKVADAIKKLA